MVCRVSGQCATSVLDLSNDLAQTKSRSQPRFVHLCQVFQVFSNCEAGGK
jgi:hypothetical protein